MKSSMIQLKIFVETFNEDGWTDDGWVSGKLVKVTNHIIVLYISLVFKNTLCKRSSKGCVEYILLLIGVTF